MAIDIFHAILVLMHVIYDIYLMTRRLFCYARQYIEDTFYGPRGLKSEIDFIRQERVHFAKPLSHLAVILGNEAVSVGDVVRIAFWSQAVGVSYVSFYDHRGKPNACSSIFLLRANNFVSRQRTIQGGPWLCYAQFRLCCPCLPVP